MQREAVLAVNAEFYRAFNECDFDGLEKVWAAQSPVACIHPGWPVLRGRDRVLASWRSILDGPGSPTVQCRNAEVAILGDAAFVTCEELLPSGKLVATNIFVVEDAAWRLVHHQAGGVSPSFETQSDDEETLH